MSLSSSLCLAVFLCSTLALSAGAQHFITSPGDLVHPHEVHDIQAYAGADPGTAATQGDPVEGVGAIDRVHAAVVERHDADPHQEEHHRHHHPVRHVGLGGFGVT